MIIVKILIYSLFILYTTLSWGKPSDCELNFKYDRTEIKDNGCTIYQNREINKFKQPDCSVYEEDLPITTDSRIKTFIYNPNEVYLVVLHYGFQSSIEFKKGEEVESITLGDSYSWKITPLNNRIFIKPQEMNIRTNMTVITNKRSYEFDIVAKEMEEGYEKDLVYVVRFYYPKKKAS